MIKLKIPTLQVLTVYETSLAALHFLVIYLRIDYVQTIQISVVKLNTGTPVLQRPFKSIFAVRSHRLSR